MRKRVRDQPGHVPKTKLFSDCIREELTRRKRFRRPDGSLVDTSELELIALKLVRELRTTTPVNSRLLDIVLNRIEGKPKEYVELDASLEVDRGSLSDEELISLIRKLGGTVPPEDSPE